MKQVTSPVNFQLVHVARQPPGGSGVGRCNSLFRRKLRVCLTYVPSFLSILARSKAAKIGDPDTIVNTGSESDRQRP